MRINEIIRRKKAPESRVNGPPVGAVYNPLDMGMSTVHPPTVSYDVVDTDAPFGPPPDAVFRYDELGADPNDRIVGDIQLPDLTAVIDGNATISRLGRRNKSKKSDSIFRKIKNWVGNITVQDSVKPKAEDTHESNLDIVQSKTTALNGLFKSVKQRFKKSKSSNIGPKIKQTKDLLVDSVKTTYAKGGVIAERAQSKIGELAHNNKAYSLGIFALVAAATYKAGTNILDSVDTTGITEVIGATGRVGDVTLDNLTNIDSAPTANPPLLDATPENSPLGTPFADDLNDRLDAFTPPNDVTPETDFNTGTNLNPSNVPETPPIDTAQNPDNLPTEPLDETVISSTEYLDTTQQINLVGSLESDMVPWDRFKAFFGDDDALILTKLDESIITAQENGFNIVKEPTQNNDWLLKYTLPDGTVTYDSYEITKTLAPFVKS